MESSLTGIPEVDQEILLTLDDVSLARSCQLNKTFRDLCNQETFWRERVRRELGSIYGDKKYPSLTWKEWYIFWKQANTSLIDTLSLTPLQGYVSIVSGQGGVLIETEFYQTLLLAFLKALEKGDHSLIIYFYDKFKKFNEKYLEDEASNHFLLDYFPLIPLAYAKGYQDIGNDLISTYNQDVKRLENNPRLSLLLKNKLEFIIIRGIGRYNLADKFGGLFTDGRFLKDLVYGLIEGHHNKEAKELIPQLEKNTFNYADILDAAVDNGNKDIIPYIDDMIPEEEKEEYVEVKEEIYNTRFQGEFYTGKDGLGLPIISGLSFEETLDKHIKDKNYENIIIIYDRIPFETLWYIYLNCKEDKDFLLEMVINCLNRNRYDFITALDLDDKNLFGREFWEKFIYSGLATSSKDLLLYILAHLNRNYPDLYEKFLEISIHDSSLRYEVYLLLKELEKIPPNNFPDHVIIASLLKSIYK